LIKCAVKAIVGPSSAAQSDWTSASLKVEGRVADYRRVIEHARDQIVKSGEQEHV